MPLQTKDFMTGIRLFSDPFVIGLMAQSPTILRIAASAGLALTLLVNALANALPLNNLTTGEVSDLYPSLFTPAGITFSIWSVIYLFLIAFAIYSWVEKQDPLVNSVLPLFLVTCFFNITWIFSWHYLMPGLSVVLMLCFLVTLIVIFRKLASAEIRSKSEIFLLFVPFTVYLAWISVATIANISAVLTASGWDGFSISRELWTVIMMFVAALLAVVILFRYNTIAFPAVVAWALAGIFIRWRESEYVLVAIGSIALMLMLLALMVYHKVRRRKDG